MLAGTVTRHFEGDTTGMVVEFETKTRQKSRVGQVIELVQYGATYNRVSPALRGLLLAKGERILTKKLPFGSPNGVSFWNQRLNPGPMSTRFGTLLATLGCAGQDPSG
ncbi:MAG: hypothetical protein Ct9H300mP16_15710 [Pseudomonadota bacterium]|nr:MAG: hypothetical protein Ct9H300mP16_15710 [Pseudomonadota bacterium]